MNKGIRLFSNSSSICFYYYRLSDCVEKNSNTQVYKATDIEEVDKPTHGFVKRDLQ